MNEVKVKTKKKVHKEPLFYIIMRGDVIIW